MRQCLECGRTYSDDTLFCLDDGAKLEISAGATFDGNEEPTIALYHTEKIPQTQAVKSKITSEFETFAQSPKDVGAAASRQNVGWIFAAFAGGLVFAGILGAAFAFYFNKTAKSVPNNINTDKVASNKSVDISSNSTRPVKTPPPIQNVPTNGNSASSTRQVVGKYPQGSTRILTENDITGRSVWDLRIMRNEIFARYGYRFRNSELRQYFESQPWYKARYDNVNEMMSDIEKNNAAFLLYYESK